MRSEFLRDCMLLRLLFTVRNWPTYFLRRFGFIKDGKVTYHLKGGSSLTLRTHSSDTIVFNDIWLQGVYDIPGFDWSGVKTVVDIGAHVGIFALYCAAHAPSAKIVAAEPEPENLALLHANVENNHLQNRVSIEPAGVAGTAGRLRLNVMPGRGECNSLYRQTEQSYGIDVPVVTLQDLFTRYNIGHCDLLKMNCEGAEYEIFYNLPDEYFRRISCMAINYHFYSSNPKHHPRELQAHLEAKGFTVTKNAKNIFVAVRKS